MIFTHSDLDGFVSALLAMEISWQLASSVHVFSYEPDRDTQWKLLLSQFPIEPNYFVDISLTPGELEWARTKPGILGNPGRQNWIWYDHHESSWNFNTLGIFGSVSLVTDGSKCAADLIAETYTANLDKFGWLGEWVAAAHDRDLWLNEKRERGMKLTMIVSEANKRASKNSAGFRDLLTQVQDGKLSPDEVIHTHSEWWQAGWKQYENSCAIAKRTTLRRNVGDLALVLCWVDGQASDVADTLYQTGDELVCMLQHFPKDTVISFRCRRDDVNCAELAKAFGGGGHAHAAGGKLGLSHLAGGYTEIASHIALARVGSKVGSKVGSNW